MKAEQAEKLVDLIMDLANEIAAHRIAYDKDWGDQYGPPVSKEYEIGNKLQELLESI